MIRALAFALLLTPEAFLGDLALKGGETTRHAAVDQLATLHTDAAFDKLLWVLWAGALEDRRRTALVIEVWGPMNLDQVNALTWVYEHEKSGEVAAIMWRAIAAQIPEADDLPQEDTPDG